MTDQATPAKVRLTDGLGGCDAAWVTYNPLTNTYDTQDGASVAAELVDNVQCLADVLRIAQIRAKQRAERANAK